eukprot:1159628-Pelagomonas_calceolata.AAC.3
MARKNEEAILLALKSVDQKFTSQSDSMAKVLIRVSQGKHTPASKLIRVVRAVLCCASRTLAAMAGMASNPLLLASTKPDKLDAEHTQHCQHYFSPWCTPCTMLHALPKLAGSVYRAGQIRIPAPCLAHVQC